jgi:hypothetical protein
MPVLYGEVLAFPSFGQDSRFGKEKTWEGVWPGWWFCGSVKDRISVRVYIFGS